MTLRIASTDHDVASAAFTPTEEWFVQTYFPAGASSCVIVEARLDATADWVEMTTMYPTTERLKRFAVVPFARLRASNNAAGGVKAWSSL